MKCLSTAILFFFIAILTSSNAFAQKFIHPGINQSQKDLEYMKMMVVKGQQPYKNAFDRLKAVTDTPFTVKAYTHVLRGPYGKPNIGDDLSKSANMAYNYALMWYITNDKKYATKAINILNAWSTTLQDFDYNDAKLLAGWTGHVLCNAAELLRYTNSGWETKDVAGFTNMLMTVYYPLIRYYYSQANGNWDGAIIHTIMSIGIFTDNRKIFDNAVEHFLHAPVNGSIFKYIYPSGQCQETMRDQGHVQLGIGEFAGAAQVAYTQGVDLFSIANNRIGLGYEYTAGLLLGNTPYSYGPISPRAKEIRDDYEYVYRHYLAHGVELPYTKRAADSIRPTISRNVLTSVRAPMANANGTKVTPKPSSIGYIAGAGATKSVNIPANAIIVTAGQSVQNAIDEASGTGRWIMLKAGVHTLPKPLQIKSGVTIAGEGISTIVFLDPASGERNAMINTDNNLHDVTIRDLVIEASTKTEIASDPNSSRSYRGGYNRGGILFKSGNDERMKNISLINLTVQNSTYSGVYINGADNVTITSCDFSENGASAIPGAHLDHNLLLTYCNGIKVIGSRLDTSPLGSGIALDHCTDVSVTNCEIARNGYYGVLVSESKNVSVKNNLIEANDRSGVMVEYLQKGSENVVVSNNTIWYNAGYGVETYAATNSKVDNNKYAGNGKNQEQQKLSNEKFIVME